MANGLFFVSWELWQQMTFVLAGAIIIVFCMGLIKLWWNNRIMRKQEIIDEEKRARVADMHRAGLAVKRGNDVPFGVRAIQSGVEVDGIWISRPATPVFDANAKLASSTTLVGVDSNSEKKGKQLEDARYSDGLIIQKHDSDSLGSSPVSTPTTSQSASRSRKHNPQSDAYLSEDTLRKLETHAQSKHIIETYVPTSAPRNPRRPSQRSSASSSGGESLESQPRSTHSVGGKSYSSSRSSRLYTSRAAYESRGNQSNLAPYSAEREQRDPFESPARTPSRFSIDSHAASEALMSLMQSQELTEPEPTFGPGDMHANKTSRRVNQGFEVLPAGTFGHPQEFQDKGRHAEREGTWEGSAGQQKPTNRLRKKSISQLPRASPTF